MEKQKLNLIKTASGVKKLMLSLSLAIGIYLLMCFFTLDINSRIILGWDTFCLSMIVLSWILFFSATSKDLCELVAQQDDGLKVIFVIVLVAICFSVFGTFILLADKGESTFNKVIHTLVSISPVFLSWILLHTIFAIRYAHLYHDRDRLKTENNISGLEFPIKTNPDYIDFAYFSFVIGMTFQVSDITVSSKTIRKFVLMHSLISFAFNTIIVALTINTIAGLR